MTERGLHDSLYSSLELKVKTSVTLNYIAQEQAKDGF